MLLGIDVGGTFTDAVLIDRGRILRTSKKPTDQTQLLETVLAAIDDVLAGHDPSKLKRVALSTTLVTNAIINKQTDPVGLLLVPGPGLCWEGLLAGEPVVLSGYTDHRGQERAPVDEEEIRQACHKMQQYEVFAVSAKFSVRNPGQERHVAATAAKEQHVRHITCASGISGGLNFIRRTNSAYFNAAVWKRFTAFAEEMERAFAARRITVPVVILKADGGTLPLAEAKQRPVEAIFTGPAASVLGVMAMQAPNEPAVSVDIGGTTTDISLWRGGAPLFNDRGEDIEGFNTSVRAFRLRSVGIGGDSFVRREDGSLKVGPRRKGPSMCLGGPEPALTDAFVVLGLSRAGNKASAIEAMRQVASQGQSPQEAAQEALRVACDKVCSEIRAMLADEAATPVYRVEDIVNNKPLEPAMLVGVGGAAEALAPAIAAEMGIACRVPAHSEVANALGAALSRSTIDITLRADTSRGDYTVPELNIRHALPKQRFSGADAAELTRTHLFERAIRAGIDVTDIVTLQQEEFNVVRGFSATGKILTVRQQVKPGVLDVLQEGGDA